MTYRYGTKNITNGDDDRWYIREAKKKNVCIPKSNATTNIASNVEAERCGERQAPGKIIRIIRTLYRSAKEKLVS